MRKRCKLINVDENEKSICKNQLAVNNKGVTDQMRKHEYFSVIVITKTNTKMSNVIGEGKGT